ncbi:MAG: hypothetical protein Q8P02_01060, partial [Candidatus Micrarchaeota archaeon]|nr:hypothetical protein [Candidatus Micrarchaeota archaeon]
AGESLTASNGMRAQLFSIASTPSGSEQTLSASFQLYDAFGNQLDTFTLNPGGEYSRNGFSLYLHNTFAGLGQASFAQADVFDDALILENGAAAQAVSGTNSNFAVQLLGGGPSAGSSLSAIRLSRMVIDDLSPGASATFLQTPALVTFQYNGLEDVSFDTLSFNTGQRNFPTSVTDTLTVEQSYVSITSSKTSPFDFGSTATNAFYYVTDSVSAGASKKGMIFYQNPSTGLFVAYQASDATVSGNTTSANYVTYNYGANSVRLAFYAGGVTALGDPSSGNGGVIAVPEFVDDADSSRGAFVLDVGDGDQVAPRLAPSSNAGVGYLFDYFPGAALPYASNYAKDFISPRGSKLESIGMNSVTIKYAPTLAHALYQLRN